MPARRLDIDNQEIARRYENGESSEKIGRDLNVSAGTILYRLREVGVTLRRSGPAPKYNDAEICRMYREGISTSDIMKKTGAENYSTFYAVLKRNGVPVRIQRHKLDSPDVQNQIKKLYAQGLTRRAIAKKIGINRGYVSDFLRQEVQVDRKTWQPLVTVENQMSVQEMREKGLTIDEIAEITGKSRVTVFQELQL